MELTLELSDSIKLLSKLNLPNLNNLRIISLHASPHHVEVLWPLTPITLGSLQNLSLQHISINQAISFFTNFECPELVRLSIVWAAEDPALKAHRESLFNKFLLKTYKLFSLSSSSINSQFKNHLFEMLDDQHLMSLLSNLEHLQTVTVRPSQVLRVTRK